MRIAPSSPEGAATERPRLLFACVENSCRSQMAEAFATAYGAGRVVAFSAGSSPADRVHPEALAAMREIGLEMTGHRPKPVSALEVIEFHTLVSMGCGDECPDVRAHHRIEWEIPDPKDLPPKEFRAIRDGIGSEVRRLLEALGEEPTS